MHLAGSKKPSGYRNNVKDYRNIKKRKIRGL